MRNLYWFAVPLARRAGGVDQIAEGQSVTTWSNRLTWLGIAAAAALLLGQQASAQERKPDTPAPVQALSALDYIEIQQLVAKFSFAMDYCGRGGQDIADLFTEDGLYTVTIDGFEPKRGREQLAGLPGGPTCEFVKSPSPGYLLSRAAVNLVIEPSPEGAKGKSYTLYPGRNGEFYKTWAGHVGGYQDVYVKTPMGWRFKSRVHVLPPHVPGEYQLR